MGKPSLLVAAGFVAASAVVAPIAQADPPARGGQRSPPVYSMGAPEAYHVETVHGTIYGEVVRPVNSDGTPIPNVPVILTISPYNALREPSITATRTPAPDNEPIAEYFVPRGYARAVFDVPGTHNSSGCFDFGGKAEREAAAAVVDHLGDLPWTNGKVGMIGISYDGSTQLEAAVEQPEHLAAIVAQAAVSSHYHYLFWGGVPLVKTPVHGTAVYDFGTGGAPPTNRSDPAANIPVVEDRAEICDRLEHQDRAGDDDPLYDEFWVERNYLAIADRIEAPILLEAGWLDTNVRARHSTRLFQALRPEVPKRLSIGQWGHGSAKFEDSVDLRHAWFDEFLLGLDTGVRHQTEVDNHPTNGNRRMEQTWPPRATKMVDIELVDGAPSIGQAGLREGESIFTDNNPAFTGYETSSPDLASTYVAYETPPLTEDVRISGAPRLRMRATSTNDSTHYCVTVITWPNIQAVTEGYLNTRFRNRPDVPEPLVPSQPYNVNVDMFDTDIIVPKGQSLFVWIASTSVTCRQDDQSGSTNDILPGSVLHLPVSEGAAALGA